MADKPTGDSGANANANEIKASADAINSLVDTLNSATGGRTAGKLL